MRFTRTSAESDGAHGLVTNDKIVLTLLLLKGKDIVFVLEEY
jgi:hypothetical protein